MATPQRPSTKKLYRKIHCTGSGITAETIRQREELQKSVLKHTNRLINQLLKNLNEADNVVKQKLSTAHLERLINYLRDDIQPLRGFIDKISLHAENLGSMKKEYELQGATLEQLQSLSVSSTCSESNSSFTRYMFDRAARETPVCAEKDPPTPPYCTPRPSPVKKPAEGFASKSCSPMRFDRGDNNTCSRDASDQVDMDDVPQEPADLSQIVDISRYAISRELRRIYKTILCWMLVWKFKITGSQRVGVCDFLLVICLMVLLSKGVTGFVEYCWRVYKTTTDMRRGVKPM